MKNQQVVIALIIIGALVILGVVFSMQKNQYTPQTPVDTNTAGTKETGSSPTSSGTGQKTTTGTKTATPVPQPLPSGVVLVSYTDAGFVPNTLEVKRGNVVRFVNNSNRSLWVITTVDTYSAFDQGKSVGKGGIFEFTFAQTGAWGYKNLNSSSHTGTIIVLP